LLLFRKIGYFKRVQFSFFPSSLMFLTNYFTIFIFLIFCIVVSVIIFFLSFFLSSKLDDTEKLTAYECGFSPFSDSRNEFDIKFYIVAILFLIFDLEISYLFPFSVCLDFIPFYGFLCMFFFLFLLTVGFFYEWKKGALDWD
jgi:NADH-quinone oxidoreductase subunit A